MANDLAAKSEPLLLMYEERVNTARYQCLKFIDVSVTARLICEFTDGFRQSGEYRRFHRFVWRKLKDQHEDTVDFDPELETVFGDFSKEEFHETLNYCLWTLWKEDLLIWFDYSVMDGSSKDSKHWRFILECNYDMLQ